MKKCLVLCGLVFWSVSAWGEPSYFGSGEWSDSAGGKGTFASTLVPADDSNHARESAMVYTLKFSDDWTEVFNIFTRRNADDQCQVINADGSEVLGTCSEDGSMSYTVDGNKIELSLGFKQDETLTDMIEMIKSIRVTISGKKTSSDGVVLIWQDTLKVNLDTTDLKNLEAQD